MALRVLLVAVCCGLLAACVGNQSLDDSEPRAVRYTGAALTIPAHRLNRAEYNATVRDLLPTRQAPADGFPADTASVNGFDNMASDLTLSPALYADYEQAARALAHEIVAPLNANVTPPTYAPAHHWVDCDPSTSDPNACAQHIITAFAERAWRRPLAASDAANLMVLWRAQTFDWSANLEMVLAAVLVSPRFVFRLEMLPAKSAGAVPLDGYQVASRLSYFLWSSLPDAVLLDAAASGALLTDAGILQQAHRMLADAKAAALSDNFAAQWLDARYLMQAAPDPTVFPAFNPNIAQAMVQETRLFFRDFLTHEVPVQDMFTTSRTFASDALAAFYGDASNRRGVLSLGAWLTVSSMTQRTSPTKRGAWILTQLLCQAPPQLPGGVNASLPDAPGANLTIRQQMSAHATNAACAACHSLMDPMGYGLENYNGVAQYRAAYPTQPIDASGQLPGGALFDGPAQLAQRLHDDPRFVACLSAKLFAYATGALATDNAQPMLAEIGTAWAAKNHTLPALIDLLVTHPAFRTRWVAP